MNSPLPYAKLKRFCEDLKRFAKGEPRAVGKLRELVVEVLHHPESGKGHPKPLSGYGQRKVWSRHVTEKHRLVYEIKPDGIVFISCYGHYDDR